MRLLILTGSTFLMMSMVSAYELSHVDLDAVRAGGEIGRRIDVTVANNLLVLDVDNDFLKPFQEKSHGEGFVGLGMLIDAMTRLACHTGNADLIARKEYVVDAAIAAQETGGYLGMMQPDARIKKLWDVHEMSYLVLGLTSDYELFHQDRSLEAARKLADYLVTRLTETPPPGVFDCDLNPAMPITGLADAFLYLSEQSGDARYKDFCLNVLDIAGWRKPIVKGRFGPIDGHVYAYVDKCLDQLRLDPDGRNPALHEESKKVLDFILNQEGLTISGACGDHECWHDTQAGTTNLGETCASTYLLKFYDELMRQSPEPLYGDLMERTVFNTFFGAQSPDGRRIRYYTPFEAPRTFFTGDTYCCPNNYRRGLADLPQYIIYRAKDGLLVNLYTACTIETTLPDGRAIRLRQETAYPNAGHVILHLDAPDGEPFSVILRIPQWCRDARVTVNGASIEETPKSGSFCTIRRAWRAGDTLDLELPMPWRLVKGRRAQVGRIALMRGPQLFALNPACNEGMEGIQPRLLTLDVDSIEGPFPDDTVRPGGLSATVQVWDPGAWYPGKTSRQLTLTEFADPGVEETYFHVPNPEDPRYEDDPLFVTTP